MQLALFPTFVDFKDDRAARERRGRRLLAVAIGLSLAIHGAALWEWLPKLAPIAFDLGQSPRGADALTARLVTRPADPEPANETSPPPPPAARPAPPSTRPPVMTAKAAPAPRVAAPLTVPWPPIEPLPKAVEPLPELQPPPRTAPLTPRSPPSVAQAYPDLASYVAAKRAARGEPASGTASPSEPENSRRDRIVAANLASINTPTFGAATRHTGGLFQITQLNSDSAEFTFFGWNRDIGRRATQRIEVRRGNASDIRIAVVRRMIAIIREYEQEDFTWRSMRLGREVTLSARAIDNAGLEDFLMREFF
jgi:hypothetical protein